MRTNSSNETYDSSKQKIKEIFSWFNIANSCRFQKRSYNQFFISNGSDPIYIYRWNVPIPLEQQTKFSTTKLIFQHNHEIDFSTKLFILLEPFMLLSIQDEVSKS
jgi:hypothetical protein